MSAASIACALTATAQAGNITFTVTGSVRADAAHTDTNGIFGDAGASLAGMDFSASLTLFDAQLAYYEDASTPGYLDTGYGPSSGVVTVTINGHSITQSWDPLSDPTWADHTPQDGAGMDFLYPDAATSPDNVQMLLRNPGFYFVSGAPLGGAFPASSIGQAFAYTLAPDEILDSGTLIQIGTEKIFARNLTWASTGMVPEPASWAMMVGGFGLAGMSLRRRHIPMGRAA